MVILSKTLQVILALSLLIIVHEFGHFIFAKLFRIKVEKFYLFFDVKGKALLRFRVGETEFGIGWLPFGGYCKIAGMVDESMDTEQLKREPQPWEFRSHPAWQRLLVMAGGVLFNFIFAIVAYCSILGIWGSAYIPNSQASIYPDKLAVEMGFKPGDRIIALDDYVPEDFASLQADMVRRDVRYAKVLRGDDTLSIYIDRAMVSRMLESPLMFDYAMPFVVDSVMSGNNRVLRKGDEILSLAGTTTEFLQDARGVLADHAGQTVLATVSRDGQVMELPLQFDELGVR